MKSSKIICPGRIILICYNYDWDDCFYPDEDALPEPDIYTHETDELEVVLRYIEKEGLKEKYEHIEVCIVERTIKTKIVKSQPKEHPWSTPGINSASGPYNKLSEEKWFEKLKELQERK